MLTGRRILIIDDNADLREIVRDALQLHGAGVEQAEDAESALAALGGAAFDALLIDFWLARTDGVTVLREIRRRGLQTPALAITADAYDTTRQRCLEAGFRAWLAKPFHLNDLVGQVAAVLGD